MRIVVAGAESTGRSTLAAGLARALELPLVASRKDEVLQASGYHTLYEWQAATHGWAALVERQLEHEAALPRGVIVEGALDLFVMLQRWAWNELSPERVEPLYQRVLAELRRCDHVFVTPPALVGGPSAHSFRNGLHNLQLQRLFRAIVDGEPLGRPVTFIGEGDAEARLAQALGVLGR